MFLIFPKFGGNVGNNKGIIKSGARFDPPRGSAVAAVTADLFPVFRPQVHAYSRPNFYFIDLISFQGWA